ncbi:MAG TPA: methyltransferase domain-containing protein [Reyranella sp.]|nr:methyltransferase domain-containing protein [Reyranella sp.]
MKVEELLRQLQSAGPLTSRDAVQQYIHSLLPDVPGRTRAYGLECDNTQTLAFVADALPAIIRVLRGYPRDREVTLLDIGPGFGGAAGLLSEMFCSPFLWAKVKVDALDIRDIRKDFMTFRYPLVNFMVGDIADQPVSRKWDIVYCSNVIEHTKNPATYLRDTMARVHPTGAAVFLAPYRDGPNEVHPSLIDEGTFAGWNVVESTLIHDSLGWPGRTQILAVIKHR